MSEVKASKSSWETKVCSRCGGCGRYSFNLVDGSRCYGCSGAGAVYTKRGRMARDHYFASMEKPVSELAVGDYIYVSGAASTSGKKFRKVLAIEPDTLNAGMLIIETKACSMRMHGVTVVPAVASEEARLAKLAASIVYMNGLTEAGKPKGPRVLAREAKAAAAVAAEDSEILAMADYYCAA